MGVRYRRGVYRFLLTRQWVIITVVAIALSGLTVLSVRQILSAQLDGQLAATASRVLVPGGGRGGAAGGPGVGGPVQAQGLLLYSAGTGFVQVDRDRQPLSAAAVAMLGGLEAGGVGRRRPVRTGEDLGAGSNHRDGEPLVRPPLAA